MIRSLVSRFSLRRYLRFSVARALALALHVLLLCAWPRSASAAMLPGFRVETIATADGFVSSVVVDSKGTVYFTTTDGWIHRLERDRTTTRIVQLPTRAGGNAGLLGMALLDDATAVVHYTTWYGEKVLDDVIARVDLASGAQTVLQAFVGDVEVPARGVSSEHHGGNPTIAPDGSVFVGIGEYGGFTLAQKPEWNGGKIWRIDSQSGAASQWALGLRNPYDLAWDPMLRRVVVADNGPVGGDELNVVDEGDNCGWPLTYGDEPPADGALPPVYTFEKTVAPTGLARLGGHHDLLRRGYLLGAFVPRALYYFSSVARNAASTPVAIFDGFSGLVIDVTEGADGTLWLATAWSGVTSIHRLHAPARGDCDGDGAVDWRDILALLAELGDGESQPMTAAQEGVFAGTWGCDANADAFLDARDLDAMAGLIEGKRRAVRSR